MKIVKIKMVDEFLTCSGTYLNIGQEYYARDCGDYWYVQPKNSGPFEVVIPKIRAGALLPIAEVIPIHTDKDPRLWTDPFDESPDPSCCPGPDGE